MANVTIYPFGVSGEQPGGAWPQKMANMQAALDMLAPWAFRDTPNLANPAYRRVTIFPSASAGVALLRYGFTSGLADYIMSPVYDLGEIGDGYSLRFSVGESTGSGQYPGLIYFDEDMQPYSYHLANADPRTVSGTVSANLKYVRLLFTIGHVFDAYVFDVNKSDYLFKGEDLDLTTVGDEVAFRNSQYWLDWGPNSRGDWVGWNFAASNAAATAQRTDINYPMFRNIGANASAWSYSISKIVELPANTTINVEFSAGVVNTDLMLRVLNPAAGTANYYAANANPRTVSIDTSVYTHVQLYFLTANYADCYIKDATNNVVLWEGAASLD